MTTKNVDEGGSEVHVVFFLLVVVAAAGPFVLVLFAGVLLLSVVAVAAACVMLVGVRDGGLPRMIMHERVGVVVEVFVDLSASPRLAMVAMGTSLTVLVVVVVGLLGVFLHLAFPAGRMLVRCVGMLVVSMIVFAGGGVYVGVVGVKVFLFVEVLFDRISLLLSGRFVLQRLLL